MQLSYMLRIVCLAVCSAGLLQAGLEFAAWLASPLLLRASRAAGARQAERLLFALGLVTRLLPWLLVFAFLLPAYVHDEDNLAAERVGLGCLALAACMLAGALILVGRCWRAAYSARRFCQACREVGRSPDGLPLLLHPGERSLMAVAGVFSSRVMVSQPLLDEHRFSPAALEVAFAHENAHARHHDNLKLLMLSLLPHFPFATRAMPSLRQQWRLAAEMAADEEGTGTQPERRLLLAEMLVAMARERNKAFPQGFVGLLSSSEHLRMRVEHLLQRMPISSTGAFVVVAPGGAAIAILLTISATAVPALCLACTVLGHRVAEFLLHVG